MTASRHALVLAAFGIVAISAVPVAGQLTAELEPAVARDFDFDLSIKSIMRGTEHVGEAPQGATWTDDGEWIYFRWRPGGGAWSDSRKWYRVRSDGGEPQMLDDAEAEERMVAFSGGDLSPDRAWRVTSVEGDLYLVDRGSGESHRLTATVEPEGRPLFSGDGAKVFFRRGDNLFSLSLEDGVVRQLTDLRSGPAPDEDEEVEGHNQFLENQQESLF